MYEHEMSFQNFSISSPHNWLQYSALPQTVGGGGGGGDYFPQVFGSKYSGITCSEFKILMRING
jgi:hypothetical protein